jgi:hypothetical protein
MEYRKAVEILMRLLKKSGFNREEKTAMMLAIGVLDMANLAKKSIKRRIDAQKAKKEKGLKW